MEKRRLKTVLFLEKSGFWILLLTLFLISFPRTWSLYSQGLLLTIGFTLWVLDFKNYLRDLFKLWFLVLPPLIYFLIHLLSIIFERADISFLEDRLMFLVIPLFGFPVFRSEYLRSKISSIISGFILGLLLVSVFLLFRIVFKAYENYDGLIPFFEWFNNYQQDYFTIGFSVLEHPTYLAMKINWALAIILFYNLYHPIMKKLSFAVVMIFTFTLFLIASKAGLLLWFILVLIFFIKRLKRVSYPVLSIILIPVFVLLTIISVMEIQRIERFVTSVKSEIGSSQTNWKNIDQRTREWYTTIQIISEKPVFGIGLSKARNTLAERYLRYNFKDEAELRLNAHNQFLETQLTFGIGGSISLLILLLSPICFRKKLIYSNLIRCFLMVIVFFLLIESLFNRQWGIMFFMHFYFLLTTQTVTTGDKKNQVVVQEL
jgi:O-antigen ligase